jgi:uncharacterized protein YkwD
MNTPSLQGNWVDFIIVIIFAFFIVEALQLGFWVMLIDFFSFLIALIVALRGYPYLSYLLKVNFSLGRSVSNALGFLLTAIITEAVLGSLLAKLIAKIPSKYLKIAWNRFLGIIPAIGEAIVLVSFVLTLLLSFPVLPKIKTDISNSKIGGLLVRKTVGVEAKLGEIFGGIIEDSLTYLTIKPGSRESIALNIEKQQLTVDEKAEVEMFKLINEERKKQGIAQLNWRPEVVPVARAHAKDMWERRYFGHVSPEGKDVGDRLDEAGVNYAFAGENLALAPTLSTAHTGLMNSEGHRANILDSRFKRIGVGVIDNGVYGKMFVQVFTD